MSALFGCSGSYPLTLAPLDWIVIGGYVVLTFALGLYFTRRASNSVEDYFLAGRSLPWYVVGTSMVATTFAADSPLAITALVREGGIAGAWYEWSKAIAIVTITIFFAKLWRRSGIITDAELVELRYTGPAARALRLIRAFFLALPVNCLILGWVVLAMVKIVGAVMDVPEAIVLPVLMIIAVVYSTASGFWGVVATDMMQFVVALAGSTALALCALGEVGGVAMLREALTIAEPGKLDFIPSAGSAHLPMVTFAVYLSVQWWAERNADGGEYLGQRMFAARSAVDAQYGTLWFAVWEFALKSWPIIVTALVSLVLLPDLANHEDAYPQMIARYLPVGLKGLLVASLLAAFMSTVDTHLNWGAGYLVNDIYKRFLRPDEDQKHYIRVSRLAMVVMAFAAAGTSLMMDSITEAWMFLLALGSGQGLVKLLRWYWWRINAWSELSALVASALATLLVKYIQPILGVLWPDQDFSYISGSEYYGWRLIAVVVLSTAVWVPVTFLTRPVPLAQLQKMYTQVRPRGGWWGPVRESLNEPPQPVVYAKDLLAWVLGIVCVYSLTMGTGKLFLGFWTPGVVGVALSAVSGTWLVWLLRRDAALEREEALDPSTPTAPPS